MIARRSAGVACEIPSRGENWYAFECFENGKVDIAGNDAIGPASVRSVEEFIVFRVATDEKCAAWCNHFAVANHYRRDPFAGRGGDVAVEFPARNDGKQFIARCRRKYQGRTFSHTGEQAPRYLIRKENAADDGIGIDNDALNGWHRSCV